jgi:hypothetical protein
MKQEEVYEYLCVYDPRNPCQADIVISLGQIDEDVPKPAQEGCACDCCFHGNDKLAREILRLMDLTIVEAATCPICGSYYSLRKGRCMKDACKYIHEGTKI